MNGPNNAAAAALGIFKKHGLDVTRPDNGIYYSRRPPSAPRAPLGRCKNSDAPARSLTGSACTPHLDAPAARRLVGASRATPAFVQRARAKAVEASASQYRGQGHARDGARGNARRPPDRSARRTTRPAHQPRAPPLEREQENGTSPGAVPARPKMAHGSMRDGSRRCVVLRMLVLVVWGSYGWRRMSLALRTVAACAIAKKCRPAPLRPFSGAPDPGGGRRTALSRRARAPFHEGRAEARYVGQRLFSLIQWRPLRGASARGRSG